jgi:Flp pilus assembly protein CpaB
VRGASDDPSQVGAEPASVRPSRHLFGAALTVVALVTMLGVGLMYVGVPVGLPNQASSQGHSAGSTSVVVAAREIPRGQRIFPDMVRTSPIGATVLPPHAFRNLSSVWFLGAAVPIHENEIITAEDLVASVCDGFCPLPQDYVAVTLPFDAESPVRSIGAGTYVNVIASVNTAVFSPVNPRQVTRTVFASVVVVKMSPPPAVQASPASITMILSPCDAPYILWLAVNASLTYTLGSPDYAAEIAAAGTACSGPIGPAQVDARWGFSTARP